MKLSKSKASPTDSLCFRIVSHLETQHQMSRKKLQVPQFLFDCENDPSSQLLILLRWSSNTRKNCCPFSLRCCNTFLESAFCFSQLGSCALRSETSEVNVAVLRCIPHVFCESIAWSILRRKDENVPSQIQGIKQAKCSNRCASSCIDWSLNVKDLHANLQDTCQSQQHVPQLCSFTYQSLLQDLCNIIRMTLIAATIIRNLAFCNTMRNFEKLLIVLLLIECRSAT